MSTIMDRLAAFPTTIYAMQFLTVGAVTLASHRMLAQYIAVTSLTPPLQEVKPVPQAAAPVRPWYRKVFSKKTAVFLLFMAAYGAFQFFIIYVIPRISSELVFNTMWIVVLIWLNSSVIHQFTHVLYPSPTTVQYTIVGKDKKAYSLQKKVLNDRVPWYLRPRARFAASLLFGLSVLGSAYGKTYAPLTVVVAAWAANMVHSITFHTFRVRTTIKALTWMLVIIPVYLGVISGVVYIVQLIWPGDGESKSNKENVAQISDWLLPPMMTFVWVMPVVPSAFLMLITHRYEYFKTQTHHLPAASAGEAVEIPETIPKSAMGLMGTAHLAWLLSFVFSDVVAAVYSPAPSGIEQPIAFSAVAFLTIAITMFSSPIFMIGALSFHTWRTGEFKAWWAYEEIWVPQYDENKVTLQDEGDVEKALLFEFEERASGETKSDI